MKYYSTRDKTKKITAAEAIVHGIAVDGGLYVPESIPALSDLDMRALMDMDYPSRAAFVMGKYLDDFSTDELLSYAQSAYGGNFADSDIVPLRILDDNTAFLELFHGPTCAFKDMALQMLPHLLLSSLKKCGENREVCILTATSGDTGKAALEGFRDVPGTRIVVFYPNEGVSQVQRLQMTTQEGGNVAVFAVDGNFDDTQTGVKRIFNDADFAEELAEKGFMLTSANSINWGRLLPQIAYYVSAYCDYVKSGAVKMGEQINFCVPTGNFGNILAASYAKTMGLPIKKLICASNRNNVLTGFINTGTYDTNRDFHMTLSPSMDILVSSNLERMLFNIAWDDARVASYMKQLALNGAYTVDADIREIMARDYYAGFCNDDDTKAQIKYVFSETGYLVDTHTAVAHNVLCGYRGKTGDKTPAVVVATASPYKFCDSVLSALGADAAGDEAERFSRLRELTGKEPPAPLTGIEKRGVRFNEIVAKNGMKSAVIGFLKAVPD